MPHQARSILLALEIACTNYMRIPRDGDQRSELMSITIPK
jgi:hypothetical protein